MSSVRRGIVVALTAIASLALAGPAAAKKFEVTERTDPAPDGCTKQDCSLREAVIAANDNPGADRVVLPKKKAYNLSIENTIPGEDEAATGDLDVNDPLRVTHPGKGRAKVDANGIDRVFQLLAGGTTSFKRIVITGGVSPSGPMASGGGGILAVADVALGRSAATGNRTASNHGGGIDLQLDAGLTLRRSSVTNNVAAGDGGGIDGDTGPLVLTKSKVSANRATGSGGAIYYFSQTGSRIVKSTISGNRAGSGGGGIHQSGGDTLSVTSSTIANNDAEEGGGINALGLTITNSTLAGNSADTVGGAISADAADSDVTANAITVVRNSAGDAGGGLFYDPGAIGFEIENSIVALNSAASGPDCTGGPDDFDSGGHNLLSTDADCAGFDAEGDIEDSNPKLGQLKDNGGLTQTVKLKKGSPAINNADKQSAPNKDQRGEKRGNKPDIGAYERIKKKQQGKGGKKGNK